MLDSIFHTIQANMSTIIAATVVFGAVVAAIGKMIYDKKKHKGSGCGSCCNCPCSGACHSEH